MATGRQVIDAICAEEADPPAGIATLGLDQTHKWLTHLERGRAVFEWDVDPAYFNLEDAVICSWVTALADQAMFFAGMTLCGEGEITRMVSLHLTTVDDIAEGTVTIEAVAHTRHHDRVHGTCTFTQEGRVRATVDMMTDVVRAA